MPRAVWVATWMSLAAPVVTFSGPNTSSSARRPPNATAIQASISTLSLCKKIAEVGYNDVLLTLNVTVGYDSDVDQVMRILHDAAASHARVRQQPAPKAFLADFGENGLLFTLAFWIADPENGQLGLRSDLNLCILRALRAALPTQRARGYVYYRATVTALGAVPQPPVLTWSLKRTIFGFS